MTSHDIKIKALVDIEHDHIDGLLKNCVTRAREFSFLSLYKDEEGRLYRSRQLLTESENNQKTDPNQSERFIYFDVFLPSKPKTQDNDDYFTSSNDTKKRKREEKLRAPDIGQQLKLKLRVLREGDRVTVREFNCVVDEIYWGRFIRTTEERQETREMDTLGLIKVRVMEQFERSLIIDTDYNLKRFKNSIAA